MKNFQLYIRNFSTNQIGIVGILTTSEPLAIEAEKRYVSSLTRTGGGEYLMTLDTTDPLPVVDEEFTPTDTMHHSLNEILTQYAWMDGQVASPDAICGQLFVRECQNFKQASGHRYLLVGLWSDKQGICDTDSNFRFIEGNAEPEINQGFIVARTLSPRQFDTDPGNGLNLPQVLKEPIWKSGEMHYAIFSDLHPLVLEHFCFYQQHIAAGGNKDNYQPHDETHWPLVSEYITDSICRVGADDKQYQAYLSAMYDAGVNFAENRFLKTEQEAAQFSAQIQSAIIATAEQD